MQLGRGIGGQRSTRVAAYREPAIEPQPIDYVRRAPGQARGCVDILPRLKAGDSSYYADWSSR